MRKITFLIITVLCAFNTKAQVCLQIDSMGVGLKFFDINGSKDKYVLFKGRMEKVKLRYVREGVKICNDCPHTETYNYYEEIIDDKPTGGVYVLHFVQNQFELSFTRAEDKKTFVFKGPAKQGDCTW